MVHNLSVAIQAGGQSTRMGRDKGLLPFGEYTLVEYLLKQVQGVGERVFVISNHPMDYAFLDLPIYSDVFPGVGALGGIYSILHYLTSEYVLVLACDMPLVNLSLVEYMIGISGDADIVIPVPDKKGFFEPFRAIYSKRCLQFVENAILSGKRRVISFFGDVSVVEISQEVIQQFDPGGTTFLNINTREDYKRLLKTLQI